MKKLPISLLIVALTIAVLLQGLEIAKLHRQVSDLSQAVRSNMESIDSLIQAEKYGTENVQRLAEGFRNVVTLLGSKP